MPQQPATTRRTALRALALSAPLPALLAACGADPATDVTPGAAAREDVSDPDLVVVAGVVAELGALVALLQRTRARHGSLRGPLPASTLRTHRAQLDAVLATGAEQAGPAAPRPRVAAGAREALDAVRQREETARRRLTAYAVDAESGALARLVAVVVAGVAQQQLVLPTAAGGQRVSTVEALQDALRAEHAAVYVYGVLGAATSVSTTPELYERVSQGWARHRTSRDDLEVELRGLGRSPSAPRPPTRRPAPAAARSRSPRRRCSSSVAARRRTPHWSPRRPARVGVRRCSCREAAVAVLGLGGEPEPLPGLGAS